MAEVTIKVTLPCQLETVWEVVTSLHNYSWRSDLSKIEIRNEREFVEYATNGYATTFTITVMVPYQRWEFDLENDNVCGHWVGLFAKDGDKTKIEFTETVDAKKWIMKPFVGMYLKKQQTAYIMDLKKALQQYI